MPSRVPEAHSAGRRGRRCRTRSRTRRTGPHQEGRPTYHAGNNVVVDVAARVEEVLAPHPAVERVELVGSRGRGKATALSDWDFKIHTTDARPLARDLPALVGPLEPLAAQWDRLVERAVYMFVV